MKRFRISNAQTGTDLGEYEAATARDALAAFLEDTGDAELAPGVIAEDLTLTVTVQQNGMPAEEIAIGSIDEASAKVTAWQDARGLGVSQLTARHGIVKHDGRKCARVSYNGRIWPK